LLLILLFYIYIYIYIYICKLGIGSKHHGIGSNIIGIDPFALDWIQH